MKLGYKKLHIIAVSLFLVILISMAGVAMPKLWATYSDTDFLFYTQSGNPGDEVDVTVFLRNNPGIAGFSLHVHFDNEIFTPINITKNPLLGGEIFISNMSREQEPYTYPNYNDTNYNYSTAHRNTSLDNVTVVWGSSTNMYIWELFTIRFRISDDADLGRHYVSLSVNDLLDEELTNVYAHANQGVIIVTQSIVWGNVTGTGYVHIGDLIRLAQHLANIPGMELYGDGLYLADVDRDGRVTVADLILLAQYLADPYYVVLGEQIYEGDG